MVHQPHRLSVATGRSHSEISGHVLLGVTPLLMANQHHRPFTKTSHASDQGLVIVAAAISMELNPVLTEHLNEIQRAGAMGVPSNLDLLCRRQILKNLMTASGRQGLQLVKLLCDIDLGISGELADLLDLLLQLHQWLLEFEQRATGHDRRFRRLRSAGRD